MPHVPQQVAPDRQAALPGRDLVFGGTQYKLPFSRTSVASPAGIERMKALMATFMQLGGLTCSLVHLKEPVGGTARSQALAGTR